MSKDNQEKDYSEYKLVRINKKMIFQSKKKSNYPKKIDSINYRYKESSNINKDIQFKNSVNQYSCNNQYYNRSYKADNNWYEQASSASNNFNCYEKNSELRTSQYKCSNTYSINNVIKKENNKEIINKLDGKSRLSYSKFHEWNPNKIEMKDQKSEQASKEDGHQNNIPIEINPISNLFQQPNFNHIYNNLMLFVPPMLMTNKKIINHFFDYNNCQSSTKTLEFLNYEKSLLEELNRNLRDECKALNQRAIPKENQSFCKEEITVELQKELSDSCNDVESITTNEDVPIKTSLKNERSLFVFIKVSKKEIVKEIIINESSNFLEIVRAFCKENNLNDNIVFSIYRKIKYSFHSLIENCEKRNNFDCKNSPSDQKDNDYRFEYNDDHYNQTYMKNI